MKEKTGKKGCLIVFEGIDGTGKTTQICALSEVLLSLGENVLVTQEPGGTDLGKTLKRLLHHNDYDPYTQFHLQMAAANEHAKQVLFPAIESGKIVLCDRYSLSREAYQGAGAGIPEELMRACDTHLSGDLRLNPDLCFVFLLDPKIAYDRSVKRDGNPCMDEKNHQKMTRISDFYYRFAHSGLSGVVPLDARKSPDDLLGIILEKTFQILISRHAIRLPSYQCADTRRSFRVG